MDRIIFFIPVKRSERISFNYVCLLYFWQFSSPAVFFTRLYPHFLVLPHSLTSDTAVCKSLHYRLPQGREMIQIIFKKGYSILQLTAVKNILKYDLNIILHKKTKKKTFSLSACASDTYTNASYTQLSCTLTP